MGKLGRGSALVWILLLVVKGGLEGVWGVSYTVGDANGWTITNYASWLAGKTFTAQDVLVFTYSSSQHDVMEVSESDYNTCTITSPLATYNDGNTTISLNTNVSNRYFICSIAGHCTAGMKLAVSISSTETTTLPPPPPPTTTTINTTIPPSSSTSPSDSKATPSPPMALALLLVGAPLALVVSTL